MRSLSFVMVLLLGVLWSQLQGCALRYEVPALETAAPRDGAVGRDQRGDTLAKPDRAGGVDTSGPGDIGPPEAPIKKAIVPLCPQANGLICQRCTLKLAKEEQVVVMQGHYALSQTTQPSKKMTLHDLRSCTSQPFTWSAVTSIQLAVADPDSARVLLIGNEPSGSGSQAVLRLGIFDLEAPGAPKRDYVLPAGADLDLSAGLFTTPERGMFAFPVKVGGRLDRVLYIHYQMAGAHLSPVTIPEGFEVKGQGFYSADIEVYPLLRESSPGFALAVWSVKAQKLIRTIQVTSGGIPPFVFADEKRLYMLQPDPADPKARVITNTSLADGTSSVLPIKGCHSFFGDTSAGVLVCLTADAIHRYSLVDQRVLKPLQHTSSIYPGILRDGMLYYRTEDEPEKLKVFALATPEPTSRTLDLRWDLSFISLGATLDKSYLALRKPDGTERTQIHIFDLVRGVSRQVKENFPALVSDQRQFFARGWSYSVYPAMAKGSNAYFIRADTATVFHKEPGLRLPPLGHTAFVRQRGLGGLAAVTSKHHILLHAKDDKSTTNHQLLVVDFEQFQAQKHALPGRYKLYSSNSFVLLDPEEPGASRELTSLALTP